MSKVCRHQMWETNFRPHNLLISSVAQCTVGEGGQKRLLLACLSYRANNCLLPQCIERAPSSVKKTPTKNKMTTPWPKARKNLEFTSQIQVFPGLRPRGGQTRKRPIQFLRIFLLLFLTMVEERWSACFNVVLALKFTICS